LCTGQSISLRKNHKIAGLVGTFEKTRHASPAGVHTCVWS